MATIRVSTQRYSFNIVREAEAAYPAGESVGCPREAVDIARHVIGAQISECLLAIFVDARNRVTGYAEVARGALNATRFTPRDVLVPALHASAGGLIVAHNHPSGDPAPSRADRQVTVALRNACTVIGVPLLDHVIVTDTGYFSFREQEGWDG
jgi:DNA repair protein RadC